MAAQSTTQFRNDRMNDLTSSDLPAPDALEVIVRTALDWERQLEETSG